MPTCSEQLLRLPSSPPSCIVLAVTEAQMVPEVWLGQRGPRLNYLLFLEDVGRRGKKRVKRDKIASSIINNKKTA